MVTGSGPAELPTRPEPCAGVSAARDSVAPAPAPAPGWGRGWGWVRLPLRLWLLQPRLRLRQVPALGASHSETAPPSGGLGRAQPETSAAAAPVASRGSGCGPRAAPWRPPSAAPEASASAAPLLPAVPRRAGALAAIPPQRASLPDLASPPPRQPAPEPDVASRRERRSMRVRSAAPATPAEPTPAACARGRRARRDAAARRARARARSAAPWASVHHRLAATARCDAIDNASSRIRCPPSVPMRPMPCRCGPRPMPRHSHCDAAARSRLPPPTGVAALRSAP